MRRNIFDLMKNSKIDVQREYARINKLFEKDTFYSYYGSKTMCGYIDEYFFRDWEKRKRNISINDMFTSLKIRDKEGLKYNTVQNLLLYIEAILNLIEISDIKPMTKANEEYYRYQWKTYDVLKENIYGLLEDLNYETKKLSNDEIIIVEKDMLVSAVAESNKNISDKIIEYRRFLLKGKIKAKREILNLLANEIEAMRVKFKGTTYSGLMEDVQFMLNNLNIRHNNLNGKNKKEYVVNLSRSKMEELYDKTFDMILGIYVINDYLDNKNEIDNLKKEMN